MKYFLFITLFAIALPSCRNNNRIEKAHELKSKANEFMAKKDYASTIEFAKQAHELFETASDTIGTAESLYLLARASALSGNFENAVLFGEKGSDLCRKTRNFQLEYKVNNTLSWAYFTLGRDFTETSGHQERQLFVVEQLNDDEAKALVYNNYGYDATVAGAIPLDRAIDYMKFANAYYAKKEGTSGRWYTLMNLCWQFRLKNNFEESEKYGRMASAQAVEDNDRHAIIEANTNLGETLLAQNKLTEAKQFYDAGLKQRSLQDDRDKYVFDVYYSRYLWATSNKDEALAKLKSAITFLEKDEVFYEMLARAFLANFSYEARDFTEAENQINFFKNPRANYISIESKVIASIIEANLLSRQNVTEAEDLLTRRKSEVARIGATFLENKLLEALDRLKQR